MAAVVVMVVDVTVEDTVVEEATELLELLVAVPSNQQYAITNTPRSCTNCTGRAGLARHTQHPRRPKPQ